MDVLDSGRNVGIALAYWHLEQCRAHSGLGLGSTADDEWKAVRLLRRNQYREDLA